MSDHARCRVCDEPLPPGTTFCARCGTRVETEDDALTGLVVDDPTAAGAVSAGADPTQPVPRAVAPAAVGGAGLPPEDDGQSNTMRWLVVALVAVIVIAVIALIAVALTRDDDNKTPSTTTTSSTTTSSTTPTTSAPATTAAPATSTPPTSPPTSPPTTSPPPTTVPPTTTTTPPTSTT